jgi:anaerobic selenocysteine-containing dehydrogenase
MKSMKTITACTLDCPDACSLVVMQNADGDIRIRGNPDHPFTSGFTCGKIKHLERRLKSRERITTPLLREGADRRPISWKAALTLCAEKIQRYRKNPAAILHFHGEGAKGVLKQGSRLFFSRLGARKVTGSLCDAAGYIACVMDVGSRKNNNLRDLVNARAIVNWGKDLSRSSIHTAAIVRRSRRMGATVLTISPGGDGSLSYSDLWVPVRPGTDRFLACAVIQLLMKDHLISENILARAKNWETFREVVSGYTIEKLLSLCGVRKRDFENLYALYAAKPPVATIIGGGVQRYWYGGENVRFINALAFISGNVGRSGGGSYFHLHSMRNFNLDWARDPRKKPRRSLRMPTIGRDILEADDPPVKMLWADGSNFVNQAPDAHRSVEALKTIEFRVVVDAFMTDTAEHADLLLPCKLILEQEDIVGSYWHDYVNYVRPVLKAPGEARSDFWIVSELGKRLDPPILLPTEESCLEASLKTPHLNTTLDALRKQNFVEAQRPGIAYAGMRFDHADGKYRFPGALHEEPPPPESYPLRLLTLVRKDHMHSQIPCEKQAARPDVWIAPENRVLKRLDLNRHVFLVSPLGRLRVNLRIMAGLSPDVVLYRRGDWIKMGGGPNQLIASGVTDLGNGAPFYSQCVGLENGPPSQEGYPTGG